MCPVVIKVKALETNAFNILLFLKTEHEIRQLLKASDSENEENVLELDIEERGVLDN